MNQDMERLALRFAGPDGLISFEANIRERGSAYFPQSLTEAEVSSLFTPAMLGELLHSNPTMVETTDVFTGSHLVRLKDILHRSDRNPEDVAGEQLSAGASVRFRNLEHQLRNLRDLGLAMANTFSGATTINAYLTPGGQKGFPPHFDNTDVFVLQLLGVKRWTLFESYTNRQELPLRDVPWDPQRYRPDHAGRSVTLRVGDVIYIPRGGMHTAECLDDISFHLTISLDPETAYDAMRSLLERWALQSLEARRRLVGDPIEATHSLRGLVTDFERWVNRRDKSYERAVPTKTGKAGFRFDELIQTLRTSRNGA
jgi:hypothetical protein